MRQTRCLSLLLASQVALVTFSLAGTHEQRSPLLRSTSSTSFTHAAWLDVNRLKIHLTNRGGLQFTAGNGYGGAFWPDTTDQARNKILFDFGPWVVGKINGVPKMGLSEWGSSYSPGPAINGQAAMNVDPSDSLRFRVYKINRGDNAGSNPDFNHWPVDLGAPVDDRGQPRLYGDQTLWTVFNNLDPGAASSWWQTHMPNPGLPVVIQQTVYAHHVPASDSSTLRGNTAFLEWTIINVGSSPIESTYVSLWTDIDFNEASDNRPGIDTVDQLAYCWQAYPQPYFGLPKAVGFVWLYGPSVPHGGSQSVFKGRILQDHRNLPLSSFWGILDDSFQDLSFYGPAYSMTTAWNITRGYDKLGNVVLDSVTGQPTTFPYSGDPVTGGGWLPPNYTSGGAGFNMFSGPFTLAPGDTQWVMAALVPVSDTSNLQCLTRLRQAAASLRAEPYNTFVISGVGQERTDVPSTVRLDQNYPNPFNPSTTIPFALPQRSEITLSVYDMLGRRVGVVAHEVMDAGIHEVTFDGSKLASGVYVYRLQAGAAVQSRKFVLVR